MIVGGGYTGLACGYYLKSFARSGPWRWWNRIASVPEPALANSVMALLHYPPREEELE